MKDKQGSHSFTYESKINAPDSLGSIFYRGYEIFFTPGAGISFREGYEFRGHDVSGQSYENTTAEMVELVFHEDTSTFTLEPLGEVPDFA